MECFRYPRLHMRRLLGLLFVLLLCSTTPLAKAINRGGISVAPMSVTEITNDFIFQRAQASTSKSVTFSGTYSGADPATIEVQILTTFSTVVVPWTAVSSPTIGSGAFVGLLTVPQGGWYHWQARGKDAFGNIIYSSSLSANQFGVGIIVSCLGQSNMQNMFAFTEVGQPTPNNLTTVITRQTTSTSPFSPLPPSPATVTGAGAITLANSLVSWFGVPVALLEYSVGGEPLLDTGFGINGWWWLGLDTNNLWPQYLYGLAYAGNSEMVIWNQGESDAGGPGLPYLAGLQTISARYLSATGRSTATGKWFQAGMGSGYLSGYTGEGPTGGYSLVFGAQLDFFLTASAGVYWAGAGVDLAYGGQGGSDFSHYTPQGMVHMAHRYAQSIANAYGLSINGSLGPTVSAVTRPAGSNVITHHGGTQLVDRSGSTAGTGLVDWSITVNGVAATITHTAFAEPNQILLTLSAAPANGSDVEIAYMLNCTTAQNAGTDNIAFDNQTPDGDSLGLPVLPIVNFSNSLFPYISVTQI